MKPVAPKGVRAVNILLDAQDPHPLGKLSCHELGPIVNFRTSLLARPVLGHRLNTVRSWVVMCTPLSCTLGLDGGGEGWLRSRPLFRSCCILLLELLGILAGGELTQRGVKSLLTPVADYLHQDLTSLEVGCGFWDPEVSIFSFTWYDLVLPLSSGHFLRITSAGIPRRRVRP